MEAGILKSYFVPFFLSFFVDANTLILFIMRFNTSTLWVGNNNVCEANSF